MGPKIGLLSSARAICDAALQLHQAGQLERAAELYRLVLTRDPAHADALQLLGVVEHQSGRHAAAVELIARATNLEPGAAHYWVNLAEAQRAAGARDEAAASLRRAIALAPKFAVAHANLALLLDDTGDDRSARAAYESAVRLDPHHVGFHVNLARHAARTGDLAAALRHADLALRIDPGDYDARVVAGQALALSGRLAEGVAVLRQASHERPGDAIVAQHLANALHEMGSADEAIAAQRQANAHADTQAPPDDAALAQKLPFLLHYTSSPDVTPRLIADEHFAWARRFAEPVTQATTAVKPAAVHVRAAGERVRVGYVSGDFANHAVARFMLPLLAAHDRGEAVEVFCYAARRPDAETERFRAFADHWREIAGVSDDAAARLVRDDGIDVLVDLSGHSNHNRLLLFARRPAPVQATYLGYANTTGLSAIDYRITDALCDPPGASEPLHSERLARVAAPFLAYAPPADVNDVPVGPLPLEAGGPVRFGSFNRPAKVSSETIAMWAQILRAVPGSRLVMKGVGLHDAATGRVWLDRFARAGVEADRIEMLGLTRSTADHLRAIGSVDVALDPFPYNGTTTTCESLLMGVPLVTRAGDAHVSRVGLSLLSGVGLGEELVARTREEYVAKAVALAKDPARLRGLRRDLRPRLLASPLCDAKRLARELEASYRAWVGRA